jgi:hypothetical protein
MTTIPDVTTTHEDNAQTIRLDMQRLAQGIPGFTLLTSEQRKKFTVSGYVDDDFLRFIGLLLDANPDVVASSHLTGAEIRDHLHFSGSYKDVGGEMVLNGRMMIDTLTSERAKIGERALRALKIARSINTPAGRDSLIPHLEAIDRDFARGRRKRSAAKKADDPTAAKKPADPNAGKKPEVKP